MATSIMKGLIIILLSLCFAQAKKIKYSVIAEVPEDNSLFMAVIVDNDKVFPLTHNKYGILHFGKAAAAIENYHYAIINNTGNIIISEPFRRQPYVTSKSTDDSTFYEFFNRSTNKYSAKKLPKLFDYPSNVHKMTSNLHRLDEIPTIHLYGNREATRILHAKENQLKNIEVKLSMTYISMKEAYTFHNVKVSLAGSSSRFVPKLSYKLKLIGKRGDNLFGHSRLKLRASGYDPSYLREKISLDCMESAGVAASGYSFVRLFIDNKAVGLFGLIESYQKPWVANTFAGGDPKYEPAYLYQAKGFIQETANSFLTSDLVYLNNLTKYSQGQYDIDDGPINNKVEDYKNLQVFTKFIDKAIDGQTTIEEWEQILDVDGFLRAMALENLLGLSDSYMTVGHNFYLYQDPREGGRFTYIPNDLDTAVGLTGYSIETITNGNYTEYPGISLRPLTKALLTYPQYRRRYEDLLLTLADGLINPTVIFPYIDNTSDMIRSDVEWDQNLERKGQLLRVNLLQNVLNLTAFIEFFHRNQPGAAIILDNLTDLIPNATFDQAINGPTPHTRSESVKPFLSKKYEAIKNYFSKKEQLQHFISQPINSHYKYFEAVVSNGRTAVEKV
ncbi:coth protein-domain-containing protein [Mycotypha africana]|uniref:coth protein-domain-containing protein n=1 Tax=Mycotypha africana TaxID=64632 RepID=UPI00230131C6|nr:coth protein-domain-containing protein [Mycotypha africana]KAI8979696.1 coth protein-domain-containing protein [Mycotypha africana]